MLLNTSSISDMIQDECLEVTHYRCGLNTSHNFSTLFFQQMIFFFKKNMPLFCRLSIDQVEVLSPSGSAMYKVSGQAAIPQGFSRCLSHDLLSDLSNLQELPSTLSASSPLKYLSSKGSIKFLLHSKLLIYSNAQRRVF